MGSEVKRIDIAEFRRLGFLQEANRQFFHPHGLALEIKVNDDGTEELGGVWDYREDAEGIVFGDRPDREKWQNVADEYERHREARLRLMTGVVQPIDWPENDAQRAKIDEMIGSATSGPKPETQGREREEAE